MTESLIIIFALSTLLIFLLIPSPFDTLRLILVGIVGLFLILGQPPTEVRKSATSGLVIDTITLNNILNLNSESDVNMHITYSFDPTAMSKQGIFYAAEGRRPDTLLVARSELAREADPAVNYSIQNFPKETPNIERHARSILNETLALKGSGINVLMIKLEPVINRHPATSPAAFHKIEHQSRLAIYEIRKTHSGHDRP